jgi:hypothetical protein
MPGANPGPLTNFAYLPCVEKVSGIVKAVLAVGSFPLKTAVRLKAIGLISVAFVVARAGKEWNLKKGKEWCGMGTYQSIYEQVGAVEERKEFREEHAFTDTQADIIKNSVKELFFSRLSKDVMRIIEAICPAETQREAVKVLIFDAMRQREGQFNGMLMHWVEKEEVLNLEKKNGFELTCLNCGAYGIYINEDSIVNLCAEKGPSIAHSKDSISDIGIFECGRCGNEIVKRY